MSTETTNKKIKIDNGTTFGRTYTDKAVDELLNNVEKLDVIKVTYDVSSSKITADVTNKPDGTYVVDIVLKTGDTEINAGTKTGLVEIGSLVDADSGSTIRTLSGYAYFNNLMFFYGIASITATTIDITGGTLAYIPTSYTINGLVKIQRGGTFGSVGLPNQGQSDSFLVYDTSTNNYNWRPVSEIDNKTISLFGNHSILVPKNSADTNILPLPADASTSTYALKAVNGTVQWVKES